MVRFLVLYDQPRDPAAFDRHYRDVHIPLTKQLPGLRRYTLSRDAAAVRGGKCYYLVAELDWDDMAALQQAFQSPQGQAAATDVPNLATTGVMSMIYELEEAL
ncbi:MAG: EthD family reductase [Actinomycetota bacterium]